MAGNDTAALVVALSAQVSKFEKDMQKAGDIADRQVSSIEDRFSKLNPTIGGLTALIPAAMVAGALASIKSVIDALAEVGDKAQDMRLPAQEMQALSMGAQQARVSADELNKALTTFTDVSKKSADDGKDFYKALQNIGAGFVESFKSAPSQSDRLRILSQAMASTTDEVKRAQLGLTAFGSDSERVTGYIAGLATSLDGLVQRAKDLGISIDDAMVKQAQTASTQLGTLAQVISAELTTAIASLIPTVIELLPYLEKIGAAVRDSIASFVSPGARPTSTLQAEIEDSVSAVKRLQKEQADLKGQEAANKDSVFSFGLQKDFSAEIALIQTKIDREKEFQNLRSKIIDGRQDAEDDKPAPKTDPAFKPRPKLNPEQEGGTNAFDRSIDQTKKRIAVLNAETATIGQNTEAVERAKVVAGLEEAAKRANTEAGRANTAVTAEQRIKINETADAMLAAARASREQQTAFQGLNDSLRFGGNELVNVLDQATQKGFSFRDAMATVMRDVSRSMLQAAITGEGAFAKLLGTSSSNGGVGGLGGLLAGLFKGGGSSELPGFGTPAFVGPLPGNATGTDNWRGGITKINEQGGEIVDLPSGTRIIPNDVARSMGGSINVPVNITVNAPNSDASGLAKLSTEVANLKASLPGVIVSTVKTARAGRSL